MLSNMLLNKEWVNNKTKEEIKNTLKQTWEDGGNIGGSGVHVP